MASGYGREVRVQAGGARLTRALKDWQPIGTAYKDRDRVSVACSCDPPRRTLMARSRFDLGPVVCKICQTEFRPA
jgi:hypothetical protein